MESMNPAFEAAERFVEGTIAAALVPLWLLALIAHLARPYSLVMSRRFSLRLGSEMWSTVYGALRDALLLAVFLGSFIYFYPDVVTANALPITGGIAGALAFFVLVLKLMGLDGGRRGFRLQIFLLGLGALLYVVPYVLGIQLTETAHPIGPISRDLTSALISSNNHGWALALCALSQEIVGVLGLVAVVYTLRIGPARVGDTA